MRILIENQGFMGIGETAFSLWQLQLYCLEIFALDTICDLFPNTVIMLHDFIISWGWVNFHHSLFIPAKPTSSCYTEHDLLYPKGLPLPLQTSPSQHLARDYPLFTGNVFTSAIKISWWTSTTLYHRLREEIFSFEHQTQKYWFNKCLPGTYCMQGTSPGTRNTILDKSE